jgi:hypothetical protein
VKLIVQLRRNAYAVEWSLARVKIRDSRDEELDEAEEETEDPDAEQLDEACTHQDPSGSVYCQSERAGRSVDWARTHHCDEIRATKPSFGFSRY